MSPILKWLNSLKSCACFFYSFIQSKAAVRESGFFFFNVQDAAQAPDPRCRRWIQNMESNIRNGSSSTVSPAPNLLYIHSIDSIGNYLLENKIKIIFSQSFPQSSFEFFPLEKNKTKTKSDLMIDRLIINLWARCCHKSSLELFLNNL